MSDSILIIAGETSGDLHGADLMKELKNLNANISFFGIGGSNMHKYGIELICHSDKLNFMGFLEVLKHIPFIKKIQKKIISEVIKRKTKYAILLDFPGFNLGIAKKLKKLNVEIFYYISPQIWAWGQSRIKKIKKLFQKIFVLFPFEEDFYKKHNVNAEFVGHPLINRINEHRFLDKQTLYKKFQLDESKEILLLLPGSRIQEVIKILPRIFSSAEKLAVKFNLQIIIACSPSINESLIKSKIKSINYKIISDHTYDLMYNAKFGIIKSGTSTLEAGLIGLPMVIVYYTSYISYLIGLFLIKVENIGIINILSGRKIVPELIQSDVNQKNLYSIVSELLSDSKKMDLMKSELSKLREILGTKNSSKLTAMKIIEYINEKNKTSNL